MNNIIFENAKYRVKRAPNGTEYWRCIEVTINGIASTVPIDTGNFDYLAIMKLVESGELVIEPADEPQSE